MTEEVATLNGKPDSPAVQMPPQLWRSLFEATLEAVLVLDYSGQITEANGAACALLELPRQALLGRHVRSFLAPDVDFDGLCQQFLAAGRAQGEQCIYLDSGTVKPVEFSATARVYRYHLLMLRDISARRQAEAERDALIHQMEQRVAESTAQLRRTETALRSQQQRLDSILNALDCVVWSVHPDTFETLYVNAAVEPLYGHPAEAFLADASLWFRCIHPDDLPLLQQDIQALPRVGKTDRNYRIVRSDGSLRWVRGQATLIRDASGQPLRIDGTTLDITHQAQLNADRQRAEAALKATQATQAIILNAIPDLMMRINREGYILQLISGGEITLYGPIESDRQSVYQDFPKSLADQRMHYVRLALDSGQPQRYEHAIDIHGRLHYEESRVVPIDTTEVLVIVRDITDRKQAEVTQAELNQKLQLVNAELNRLATIDGLTQIANRRSFDQALDMEWQRARRQQQQLALVLCDIDYFKPYNDNYGHLAGDDCLRQVAQVLNTVARRPGDLAARYGGEEFVLLLPDTAIEGAIQVVEQVQGAIAAQSLPHAYSAISPVLTLSFGLVCHRPTVKEHSPRELIHRADLALYEAKAQGRNRYVVSEG